VNRRARADLSGHGREEVAVRGRQENVHCYTVADATILDAFPSPAKKPEPAPV